MNNPLAELRERWAEFRHSDAFHNALVFLACVGTAAVFWFVLALNDSAQDTFEVRIRFSDVPDSVTFISDVPDKLHVTVRDKGTSLMRNGRFRDPVLNINFNNFAQDNILRFSKSDMLAAMKGIFGSNAAVSSMSLDSLRLVYTTSPGRKVPVIVVADVSAASGNIISSKIVSSPRSVYIYTEKGVPDTVARVYTQPIRKDNLSETTTLQVAVRPVPHASIQPSKVNVTIPVEPLVLKETMVNVETSNVPPGSDLLLFPSKVKVSYYVPMSRFSEDQPGLVVSVDYADVFRTPADRIPLYVSHVPGDVVNVELGVDSVEYTLVKDR